MVNNYFDINSLTGKTEAHCQFKTWFRIENSILSQIANVKWLNSADDCTKFFNVVVKENKSYKKISKFVDTQGGLLESDVAIRDQIVRFYTDLMGTTTPGLIEIDPTIVRNGPILDFADIKLLIAPVTCDEIKYVVFSMDSSKIPRIDGFNGAFFFPESLACG